VATTETSYGVLSLPPEIRESGGDKTFVDLRRTFDLGSALTAFAESVAQWELYKDLARKDDDFVSLREDPRFVELVG
jgi:hypothetical protein